MTPANLQLECVNPTFTISIQDQGTNPTKADTDGDLLIDGFEVSNQMNPKVADNSALDYDNDNLTNLQEQGRKDSKLFRQYHAKYSNLSYFLTL
jgi:hypothetical protein